MKDSPKASLTAALNDLLKGDFDGVPSNSQISLALNRMVLAGNLPLRDAILLDALGTALVETTADGWKFSKEISGRTGSKRSKETGRERREIAQRYAHNLADAGDFYARRKAIEDGDRSAKEAYEEHKPSNRLARLMAARTSHENRIEELRHLLKRLNDSES